MPYFKTSQEWLDHSVALLEARPSSTRVTTRYSIKPVKPRKQTTTSSGDESSTAPSGPRAPRGSLVLKTYDPVSGVTLKYRTTKAAEVTRLMSTALGRLGKAMAGIQDVPEETMQDADAAVETPQGEQTPQHVATGGGAGGGGGGKKKKKGKK